MIAYWMPKMMVYVTFDKDENEMKHIRMFLLQSKSCAHLLLNRPLMIIVSLTRHVRQARAITIWLLRDARYRLRIQYDRYLVWIKTAKSCSRHRRNSSISKTWPKCTQTKWNDDEQRMHRMNQFNYEPFVDSGQKHSLCRWKIQPAAMACRVL